jgi:pimeloyl-ACP methyl ester carboxylesterase
MRMSYICSLAAHGSGRPLFCTHVGGGANLHHYEHLVRFVAGKRPVLGLLPRGHQDSEAPHSEVSEMAQHCIAVMREHQSCGPYLLCGYSSGGTVAYEIACQLEAAGERPGLVILIDPHIPPALFSFVRMMAGEVIQSRKFRLGQEWIYFLVLTRLGVERRRKLRQMGESHRWAVWRYKPGPYNGPVAMFVTQESTGYYREQTFGLYAYAKDLHTKVLAGNHGTIMRDPEVAIAIKALLDSEPD